MFPSCNNPLEGNTKRYPHHIFPLWPTSVLGTWCRASAWGKVNHLPTSVQWFLSTLTLPMLASSKKEKKNPKPTNLFWILCERCYHPHLQEGKKCYNRKQYWIPTPFNVSSQFMHNIHLHLLWDTHPRFFFSSWWSHLVVAISGEGTGVSGEEPPNSGYLFLLSNLQRSLPKGRDSFSSPQCLNRGPRLTLTYSREKHCLPGRVLLPRAVFRHLSWVFKFWGPLKLLPFLC